VIIPLVLLGALGGGYALFSGIKPPTATEAPATSLSVPATNVPEATATVPEPTSTTVIVDTATVPPTATEAPVIPKVPVIGGADKIALVANNEIWTMNVDGTDPKQLTVDGASKNDLQWLPDGNTILFLSGKTVKFYNITTDTVDTLTSFPSAVSLDAFQVSHDGKRVMIAMSNEIFVVPFDFETMKNIRTRGNLFGMEGSCILPTGKTNAALAVREARWSADDKLVAWLYKGVDASGSSIAAEQVSVFNIQDCRPETIRLIDNFPGTRFNPVGFQDRIMPDFDWDGFTQFAFNTSRRNNGWGEFYIYNYESHRPSLIHPIDNKCCYRDARWSPDGSYLFFAFQDIGLGPEASAILYYIPAGELEAGANFKPIPMPPDFFKNPREAPQPALRPAKP